MKGSVCHRYLAISTLKGALVNYSHSCEVTVSAARLVLNCQHLETLSARISSVSACMRVIEKRCIANLMNLFFRTSLRANWCFSLTDDTFPTNRTDLASGGPTTAFCASSQKTQHYYSRADIKTFGMDYTCSCTCHVQLEM